MPRITRKQQKVFAVDATNNGVFGSLQANDPAYSQDPDAIQGRTAYSNGWNDATYSSEKLPPLEEFQALQYLFSRQLAYLMQEGIAEWDTNTTYYKGALVKSIQSDGSFILYASLIDNNQGNLVTDTTKWVITNTSTNFHQGIPNWRADVIYSDGDWVKSEVDGKWTIFESLQNSNLNNAVSDTDYWKEKPFGLGLPLFYCTWADHQLNDQSWLRADTFSWQDGTFYSDAYNHLVEDYNGGTTQSETIGSYTISYKLASDGHKITTDESTVTNIYNETGVAWYYILDTTNQRFKLPRTKFGFTGLRDTVGKFVQQGLPNITGNLFTSRGITGGYSGAFYSDGNLTGVMSSTSSDSSKNIKFSAAKSNSIYGNSSNVQPRATQMYLYFYVGDFSQTATEQTAGLNAELFNGKVDLNLNNIDNANNAATNNLNSKGIRTVKTSYKSGSSWYRIYSDGWVEQGGSFSSSDTEQNKTVNLLKTMSDSNYFISLQRIRDSYDATATASVVRSKGTSSFRCYGLTSSTCWEVKGFGS